MWHRYHENFWIAEKYPWSPPSKDNAHGLAKTTDSSKPDEEMPSQSSKTSKHDEKAQDKSSDPGDEKSEAGAKTAEKKGDSENNKEEKWLMNPI